MPRPGATRASSSRSNREHVSRSMVRLGWCHGMRSDYEGATRAIETASQVADLPQAVRAVLHSEVATLAAWTFRTDLAASAAEAALELGDPAGATEATVQARCIQSFLAMLRGDIGDAVMLARDAARRAVALGDAHHALAAPLPRARACIRRRPRGGTRHDRRRTAAGERRRRSLAAEPLRRARRVRGAARRPVRRRARHRGRARAPRRRHRDPQRLPASAGRRRDRLPATG